MGAALVAQEMNEIVDDMLVIKGHCFGCPPRLEAVCLILRLAFRTKVHFNDSIAALPEILTICKKSHFRERDVESIARLWTRGAI